MAEHRQQRFTTLEEPLEECQQHWELTGDPAWLREAFERAYKYGDPIPAWMADAIRPVLAAWGGGAGRPSKVPAGNWLLVGKRFQQLRRQGLSKRAALEKAGKEYGVDRKTAEKICSKLDSAFREGRYSVRYRRTPSG